MYQTVNEAEFVEAFDRMNREANFSRQGRRALFQYLTNLEEDIGEPMELDVIALCCDFNEWADLVEFQHEYGADEYPDMDAIRDATTVIEVETYGEDGPKLYGFITQVF